MPDQRRHRGPHPEDIQLFAASHWERLQTGTAHLSWLLSRGYAMPSACKLVGDRFELVARQRLAVQRSACADVARQRRARHQLDQEQVSGHILDIDGFNLLTTIEAALAGGILLQGRDGCLRDMASMHGNYRKVEETLPALEAIGQTLLLLQPASCTWWLDRPVSNSGRVSQLILKLAARHAWTWETRLVSDPDLVLRGSSNVAVTADSVILDAAERWFDLATVVVTRAAPSASIMTMSRHDAV